ncbi:MAG: hypothetical protein IJD92_02140 [Bacilli bacterium]|nr:hypothetical protein [Bacilli bacterium]
MKKILKKVLYIFIIITLLVIIDLMCIFTINRPIFAIKDNNDSVNIVYKGLLYNVYKCQEYSIPQIKLKNNKFSCSLKKEELKIKELIDKTKEINDFVCAEALENFYEDELYTYYWNCMKNEYMIVRYENGFEETIQDALKNKSITITDLDKFNINYIKYEKEKNYKLSVIEEDNCNLKLNEYYESNNRTIYTTCIKEIYIERNNNKLTLKNHLLNIYQTIDESIKELVSDINVYEVYKDGGTTLYKKDNYAILLCNTIEGNKDVYIGNKDLKYEQGYCK